MRASKSVYFQRIRAFVKVYRFACSLFVKRKMILTQYIIGDWRIYQHVFRPASLSAPAQPRSPAPASCQSSYWLRRVNVVSMNQWDLPNAEHRGKIFTRTIKNGYELRKWSFKYIHNTNLHCLKFDIEIFELRREISTECLNNILETAM